MRSRRVLSLFVLAFVSRFGPLQNHGLFQSAVFQDMVRVQAK